MHDGLKDTVHHDVLQHDVLTDVVCGRQNDEQQTKTEILQTSCISYNVHVQSVTSMNTQSMYHMVGCRKNVQVHYTWIILYQKLVQSFNQVLIGERM